MRSVRSLSVIAASLVVAAACTSAGVGLQFGSLPSLTLNASSTRRRAAPAAPSIVRWSATLCTLV